MAERPTRRPTVSVVIPTRDRKASLRRTLGALCAQTYPLGEIEVVVVVDGSTDGTRDMLRHYVAPFALHVVERPGVGSGGARTAGAACASGRLILFLDDDMEATPALIDAHVRAHGRQSDLVVVGHSPPFLRESADFLRRELQAWWRAKFEAMARPGHRYTYCDLLTGNLSLPAEVFVRVGGFDPAFSPLCHEDYELGVRLLEAGIRFSFATEALAYHHEHEAVTLDRFLHRKEQEGRADVLLGWRHAELRPVLPLAGGRGIGSAIDRALCVFAFRFPATRDRLGRLLPRTLALLEAARLWRVWRIAFRWAHRQRYWRGVAEALGSLSALSRFLSERPAFPGRELLEIDLDLGQGLEAVERRLDAERPSAARIYFGRRLVGRVPSAPGAERLRGAHLRPLLTTALSASLRKAERSTR